MLNGPARGSAAADTASRRRSAARHLAFMACVAALAAGCDQFSTQGVAETCVRSALKAGEPYGNQQERQQTEAQLRQYCKEAAQGK